MASRCERGLYFNCDEIYAPGHLCKPKFQCLIIEDGDDPSETIQYFPSKDLAPLAQIHDPSPIPPPPNPNISLHTLEEHQASATLRIEASICGKPLIILIDGGSTHNFMQGRIAKNLRLPIEPARHLSVTVGNGDSLSCEGFCAGFAVSMGGHDFMVDLHLLPIYGADMVVGVDLLAQIGPVLFDYPAMWLSFVHKGAQIKLHGLTQSILS